MPLFRHKRLILVAMLAILAIVNGAALYVRPLSGATGSGRATFQEVLAAVLPASR